MRSLDIASTGMQAQQTNVEVISNNIANMSTTGFKRRRAEFQDLISPVSAVTSPHRHDPFVRDGWKNYRPDTCTVVCAVPATFRLPTRHLVLSMSCLRRPVRARRQCPVR